MKLLRYGPKGSEQPGLLDADGRIRSLAAEVTDIDAAAICARRRWTGCVRSTPAACPWSRATRASGPASAASASSSASASTTPITPPRSGLKVPPEPVIFMKATSAVCGPNDEVEIPRGSREDRLGGRARRGHRHAGEICQRSRRAGARRRLLRRQRRLRARLPDRAQRASGPRARATTRSARSARGW